MLLFASVLMTVGCPQQAPARSSRAAFCHAMATIEPSYPRASRTRYTVSISGVNSKVWTPAAVKQLLGPPDDIYVEEELPLWNHHVEEWSYGTHGPGTMATLGFVRFENGRATLAVGGYGEPPSQSVIGEAELTAALDTIFKDAVENRYGNDPLCYIRVANLLIAKGQKKALAILGEYSRLVSDGEEFWLFWLVRVAFTSREPGGPFATPGVGNPVPTPAAAIATFEPAGVSFAFGPGKLVSTRPAELKHWPTYPISIVNGIPFSLFSTYKQNGPCERFSWYLADHSKCWVLKTQPIAPPDDPFLSYAALLESTYRDQIGGGWGRMMKPNDLPLGQVLSLVRDVYAPPNFKNDFSIQSTDFDKFHQQFLATHSHWDKVQQKYVSAVSKR